MRLFNKFFSADRKNGNALQPTGAVSNEPLAYTPVHEDLFVDREAPSEEASQTAPRSELDRLAMQDLAESGYADGYRFHDPDVRSSALERIRAGVRHALESEIDLNMRRIGDMEVMIQRLEGDASSQLRALKAKKQHLEHEIMRLREGLLLTDGNSGFVEIPVSSYSLGFGQGVAAYIDAELLTNKYAR